MEHGEERLVVTNKPEEEGRERGKGQKYGSSPASTLPSFPFRIFRRCHKPLFGRRSFPCFRTKAKPQRAVEMRRGRKSPRSDLRPFSVERRGYFHAHWVTVKPRERERGRFIFLDNTPDSPSSLPIAICPYFCPDHQKGYRRFGGFNL